MFNNKICKSPLKKTQNLFSDFLIRSNNIIIWYNYVQWNPFTDEFAINNIVGRIIWILNVLNGKKSYFRTGLNNFFLLFFAIKA